ncbi:MAG: ABC transporter substrate-binding protein [Ruminococcus flavefaciens]|nr:ABC transporter substrate-binding protein [Ruminococcus flavefaciens]MCM1228918.1 ABC transporter substrate-binding protein [Ruminococcus flavefaciens]
MKKTSVLISALLTAVLPLSLTACGDGNTADNYDKADVSPEVRSKINQRVNDSDLLEDTELENKTIKWLSDWNINPDKSGKTKPPEVVAFEEKYGGKIEWIQCTYEDRYEQLAKLINSGEGVDFFYAGNMDAFPRGTVSGMFAPVDDYIDFSDPVWESVKEVNDSLIWNGNHYCTVLQTLGDKTACVYNRKTIQEAGLDDPAELYANGEWDWNAFQEMLQKFVDVENQHYGLDGWWFEFGLMETTGTVPVTISGGKLVNNLGTPAMERAQNLLYNLNQTGCIAIGQGDYGWDAHPEYIGEGKLLFYPVGLYEFYKTSDQWKATFGEDAFFVPMPKDPEADEYYVPVGIDAYMFVKGGQNPEGVAKYLECKRFVLLDEETKAIADEQFRTDYGWTDEMVEMQRNMQELADKNPSLDLSKGVSADCGELLDSNLRLTAKGTPWSETYDAINSVIDTYLDEVNELNKD